MMMESEFQNRVAETFKDLEDRVWPLADQYGFEVESGGGMITLEFEDSSSKFIISPQTAARQIWVSALVGSYKFDWDPATSAFVLDKSGEPFLTVMTNLLARQLGSDIRL